MKSCLQRGTVLQSHPGLNKAFFQDIYYEAVTQGRRSIGHCCLLASV